MRSPLAAASAALVSFACATSQPRAPENIPRVMASAPGVATGVRTQSLTATVKAVDVSARTVTLEWAGGQTGTFKVRPEVTRFDEIVAGDVVQIDVEQQLRLEYQPPGIASVPYTVGGSGQGTVAMAGGSISSTAIESTVTVTAIDRDRRRVRFQDPAGATYEVTAGTGVELEKLKVGDRLLATYVEATAVRLEKPARKP